MPTIPRSIDIRPPSDGGLGIDNPPSGAVSSAELSSLQHDLGLGESPDPASAIQVRNKFLALMTNFVSSGNSLGLSDGALTSLFKDGKVTPQQCADAGAEVSNNQKLQTAKQTAAGGNEGTPNPPCKGTNGSKLPSEKGDGTPPSTDDQGKSLSKWTTTQKVAAFFGASGIAAIIAFSVICIVSAISLRCTDGATCTITGSTVVNNSTITLNFTVETPSDLSCAGLFKPSVNDSIRLNGDLPYYKSGKAMLSNGNCYTIVKINDPTGSINVNCPDGTSGFNIGSPGKYGTFQVDSTFDNQMAQNLADAIKIPLDALGDAAGAGAQTFCDILPFLCTNWIMIIVAVLILLSSASGAFFAFKH